MCVRDAVVDNKKSRNHFRLLEGGTDGNRTSDTRIFSPLLYQLSYGTSVFCAAKVLLFFVSARKKSKKRTFFLFCKLFFLENQPYKEFLLQRVQ